MERRRRQVPASIPLSGLLKSIEKKLNSDPLFAKIGWFCRLGRSRAPVAQLDRAFAFEAKGCRFDSCPGASMRRLLGTGEHMRESPHKTGVLTQ